MYSFLFLFHSTLCSLQIQIFFLFCLAVLSNCGGCNLDDCTSDITMKSIFLCVARAFVVGIISYILCRYFCVCLPCTLFLCCFASDFDLSECIFFAVFLLWSNFFLQRNVCSVHNYCHIHKIVSIKNAFSPIAMENTNTHTCMYVFGWCYYSYYYYCYWVVDRLHQVRIQTILPAHSHCMSVKYNKNRLKYIATTTKKRSKNETKQTIVLFFYVLPFFVVCFQFFFAPNPFFSSHDLFVLFVYFAFRYSENMRNKNGRKACIEFRLFIYTGSDIHFTNDNRKQWLVRHYPLK